MWSRLRPRSVYDLMAVVGCVAALTTGVAYAANTIGSVDVIDESLRSEDIKDLQVKTGDLATAAVTAKKIRDGSIVNPEIAGNAVTSSKILNGSVGPADVAPLHGDNDIQDNTVSTFDLATDSVDADEVLDFGLSNEDVGVLGAEVDADGTLANANGVGITASKLGATGTYEVGFGRDVSDCTSVATIGPAGAGTAAGEINVADRAGVAEAVAVDTNDSAGTATDLPFRLVVVC